MDESTLGPTRKLILDFVRTIKAQQDRSPTIEEIRMHAGLKAHNTVCYHLSKLRKANLLPALSRRDRILNVTGLAPNESTVDRRSLKTRVMLVINKLRSLDRTRSPLADWILETLS